MILFPSGAHRRLRRLWRSHGQGLHGGVNLACLREGGLPGRWPWSWPLTMMLTVKTVIIARLYLQPPSLMLFFLNDTYLSISWTLFFSMLPIFLTRAPVFLQAHRSFASSSQSPTNCGWRGGRMPFSQFLGQIDFQFCSSQQMSGKSPHCLFQTQTAAY